MPSRPSEHSGVEKAVEELAKRLHEDVWPGASWSDEEVKAHFRNSARDHLAAIRPFLAQPEGDGAKQLEKRLLDKGPFGGVEALARLLAAERGGSVVDGAGNYSYEQFERAHKLLGGILTALADHPAASPQPENSGEERR